MQCNFVNVHFIVACLELIKVDSQLCCAHLQMTLLETVVLWTPSAGLNAYKVSKATQAPVNTAAYTAATDVHSNIPCSAMCSIMT